MRKLLILVFVTLLILCGCGQITDTNAMLQSNKVTAPSAAQTPATEAISPTSPSMLPEFEPYIYIYEVIGSNNDYSPILIPINDLLLNKIKEAIKSENEVDVELDLDIWKVDGKYTDDTYSWIGLDVILSPDAKQTNRQWALLVNPKSEGVLCDYWYKDGEEKAYEATDICNEIIGLANETLAETEYGDITKFTLISAVKDIVKVESYENYNKIKLKEYTDKDTIEKLEKMLASSIEGGIGANAINITGKPYYTLKLTKANGEELIIQFAQEEYLFKLNNWMVYMHESGDFNSPMHELIKLLDLNEWPNIG